MKKIYICFGGRAYDETTAKIVDRGPRMGADEVWVYDDRWLIEQDGFRKLNHWLWETPQEFGFGWCSWKAYVIMDALSRLRTGDVVLYTDADCFPIADLSILFEECSKAGIFLFNCVGWQNYRVVKRDCFIAMGLDEPKYHNAQHACARFGLFRKGFYLAQQLLMEWHSYSINPMCQLWDTSRYGQDLPDFFQNRTEQAVLSLLAAKYDIPLHREADQNGSTQPEDTGAELYPQLFEQVYCSGDRTDLQGSRFRNIGFNTEFS